MREFVMGRVRAGMIAPLIAVWLVLAGVVPLHAETSAVDAKKVVRLLQGTGLKYTAHEGKVWTVDFAGKKIGRSTVVVTNNARLLVIFADIARSKTLEKGVPLMQALLHADHSFDYVKIGFDDDGDLFVRIDAPLRVTDARQLKDDIRQVMRVADDLYGAVTPYIKR
ncbi:MAG TPA: hypothetical protein VIJ42_06200 [Stellaceae bacterium]